MLSFFPRDVLDEILDLIESVSEDFSTYCFFTSDDQKRFNFWSCQKVCDTLIYLFDFIFIRFGTKLHGQIVGIPMGTNCTPLIADLFLFCYERDFMMSLVVLKLMSLKI